MILSADLTMKVAEWRQKSKNGELTVEECREALSVLRSNRAAAQVTSTKSRAKKAPVNADDLLSQLEGL